jgi:single-strand DNA-binding protein
MKEVIAMRDVTTTIFGNVTKEPEEGQYKDGTLKVRLGLAINSQYYDRDSGKYLDRPTQFASAFTRGALARNVLRSVHKGDPVVVHGRVGLNQWEEEDGATAKVFIIHADGVGHDLQFGTSTFTKPARATDARMDMDYDTGEIFGQVPGEAPLGETTESPAAPEAREASDGEEERVPAAAGASVPF